MERYTTTRNCDNTKITKPRFPHLKPKSQFEVLQYRHGREFIIKKLTKLEWKFQEYLDCQIKPVIRKNTEPWTILKWYYEAIEEVLALNKNIDANLSDYIQSDDDEFEMKIENLIDQNEIFLIGTNWIKLIPTRYQNWFNYIYHFLEFEIGCFTIWDYINEFDAEESLMDWYSFDENTNSEDEEYQDYLQLKAALEETIKNRPAFRNSRPKRIPKPQNEAEVRLSKTLNEVLILLEDWDGHSLHQYQEYNDDEEGLDLTYMFSIVDNGKDWNEYVSRQYYEMHVECIAQGSGVKPWSFRIDVDDQFSEENCDTKPYEILNEIFYTLMRIENSVMDDHDWKTQILKQDESGTQTSEECSLIL